MNNLNSKMQAHARVCEENRIRRNKRGLLKQFFSERYEFEGLYRKSGEAYQNEWSVLKDDSP